MKVVHGAPPSYRDEMDKLNVRKSVRRDLDRGFSVAIDSRWDDSLNALVFTVVTPYGEKSQMTLTNTDVPRRISNMCPVVQDPTLLTRDPSTPSELLGQFLLDPTRVAEHVRKRGIKPYDYVNKAIHDIESLPGGYVGAQSSGECLSKFDCMQRTATAVFSYDIATPKFGADGASAAIITGDAAEVWNFFGLAKMPLQDSLLEVFCSAIGVKPDDSLEKRINSPMKRSREVPLFQVTDTKKQGLDFTSITNLVVLTMNSIPCILNDTFLRQINTVLSSVYPLKEEPIVPGSIFHAVSEKHRDGLGQDQVTTLGSMVTHDHFNNTMRLARESKGRVESCVSYHRHLACLVCGQDLTSNASLLQEVTDPKMIHCGVAVHNAGKFVTTQTKATRRSYSLDCVRRVKILGKDWPQFDKGQGRFGILTKDETKCIFERPCVISECLRPMVLPDIGNQRSKYDNVSSTVYVLVPFDRQATLERLKEEGVQDPQASLLTLHNVVECIVPIYSSSEGLVEYRCEALAFRGKHTISVQAYGKTPMGDVPLYDPESTTKRLSIEMLGEDGKVRLHQYKHQLEYNRKRYFQTQGTMLSITNFKQYKIPAPEGVKPIKERTNWDKYGYTLVGALAANFTRAHYAGRPLLPPERLQFGVVSDTREQKARSDKRKLDAETKEEIVRLRQALEKERERTSELSMELRMADLRFELNDMCNQEERRRIEELEKMNEKILEDYSALENAKNEQIRNLEASLDACNMKLKKRKRVKRLKVRPTKKHFNAKKPDVVKVHRQQEGPVLSWLPEYDAAVLAV